MLPYWRITIKENWYIDTERMRRYFDRYYARPKHHYSIRLLPAVFTVCPCVTLAPGRHRWRGRFVPMHFRALSLPGTKLPHSFRSHELSSPATFALYIYKKLRPQTYDHNSAKSQPFYKNLNRRFLGKLAVICSELVFENLTTPCTCCRTTLWNINVRKQAINDKSQD